MIRSLIAVFCLGLGSVVLADGASKPAPLKVLFLGDQGHHQPADRAAQLIPALALRGIEITYSEKLEDLNPSTLARYDALLIFANIEKIEPAQEKALLDYVENGGAFVPLHCASYCFLNSPRYVALVGAQFQRHGTGEFDTKIVDPAHPIMRGIQPFRTWDETYVHHKHNEEARHVLQTRAEGSKEEPWTWIRTQGKGRVFYTAYGHDARTWQNPGFHDLVERGIRWAVGKGEVRDSRPKVATGLKPFAYQDAGADIPNYLPGQKWGSQGEPYRRMPRPIDAAESSKHLALPGGFEAKLFVSEPEIARPICMAWDHRGRLWIVESVDYPNAKRPGQPGRDRIKICEDRDGDGRAETFTVFAEGLNIPTSLCFANGGVIVQQAPDTLFLRDTNGDDRVDETKVLFTGWGTDDTHAGPSNLRYGLDNWIWGIVGYSAFHGTVGGDRHDFSQGFYRFKPDGSKLEFLRSTNNNSWGVGLSEEGLVFGSTANGCPSVYLSIPNRYYEAVRGWSPRVLQMISASNQFFPVTDKVRQVDWHGGFTAAAGHALYTARAYPRPFWNRTAFVTEPTGHLVATFTLQPRGSDFSASYGWNLVASDDEWTSPIMAEVGPDGSVWMIDWYNYIVQHNPTPQGFKTGKGNAYETPLRDKTHGRIYRIVYGDSAPTRQPALDPGNGEQLVSALKSDNQFWRLHAQRLLIERGRKDVVPALLALAADPSVDAIGLNTAAIHALWTLKGLGETDQKASNALNGVEAALRHPSAGVRRNALLTLPRDAATADRINRAGSLADKDSQVRLSAFLTLADLPAGKAAGQMVAGALVNGAARNDRWLADAATSAAAAHDRHFLEALATHRFDGPVPDPVTVVAERVAEHHARGGPVDDVARLLAVWENAQGSGAAVVTGSVVSGLAKGWPRDRQARLDAASEQALVHLASRLDGTNRGRLISLATRWGSKSLEGAIAQVVAGLMTRVVDETGSDEARLEAARQLVEFRPSDISIPTKFAGLINPRTSPQLASGLIDALGKSSAPNVGKALVETLPSLVPAARAQAVRTMLARGDWTPSLLDAIEGGGVRLSELRLDQKQALASHPSPAIADRAKRLLGRGGDLPDPDRQKVIDQLAPRVLEGGDVAKGKVVFTQQCAKCHRHGGEGAQVGPDLTGMAAHPRSELLVHILDPSRSVEGNYVQYTVATSDGRVINGLLASETRTTLELLDSEAKRQVVLRSDVEEMKASRKSLMPEGFEKQVGVDSISDLLAFLTQRGKYLPLDLRKVATIVSTRGMFYDPESRIERLVFNDWSPKNFEGIPFVLVDPQGDRVPNAILLYSPNGESPPRMPKAVELPCNTPAKAIHLLSGVSGWGYAGGDPDQSVSMIVRLRYADGRTEDHPLLNGVHFSDYIRPIDVPGSRLAFRLRGQQMRYLKVEPKTTKRIDRIELVKGPDQTAPVVMAVTVETE